jgi:DNA-binding GntR family transcriptional regulator
MWRKLRERRVVRPTRVAEHEAVLRAVASRDPQRARRAMHAHFDGAIRDFLEMTTADEPAPSSARPAA